jgi:uncharacterized SAM-binding protein YcdF (DUF218 family)
MWNSFLRLIMALSQTFRNRRRFWLLAILLLVVAAAMDGWVNRITVLRSAAAYWIVSDPEGPADAVAILGGGVETRPFAAAEYYRNGLARKVVLSSVRVREVEKLGLLPLHSDLNQAVLIKLGVPAVDIELFGKELSNTYEEAVALRGWAVLHNVRSIIVPTEIFPSRRVRWILNREFAGTSIFLRIIALDDPEFSRTNWWKNESGIISFQNEIIKHIYYRLKY